MTQLASSEDFLQVRCGLSNRTLPEERRRQILEILNRRGSITVAELGEIFGISPMTIRRDLDALERAGQLKRTHGGAILPSLAQHEDSFSHRLTRAVEAKELLAEHAAAMLKPGEAVFLDSSTTAYYLARRIVQLGLALTIVTNSLPIMELVAKSQVPRLELISIGGSLRKLTLSFVGQRAVADIRSLYADKVYFSVKGVTSGGDLTDPDPQEAEAKRAMIEQAREAVLLVDETKFEQYGLCIIGSITVVSQVLLADAGDDRAAALRGMGVQVRRIWR
ncbi:Lactose phosphotransferase system repressor [bacterium HR27]|nr:Lactose phosphotransferase system repressor [bacterium HR27]